MVADLLTRGSNEQNVPKVKSLFPLISKEILCISPSTLGAIDDFVWTPTKDGVYATKSGYFIAMKNRATLDNEADSLLELEWTKKVWGTPCPPKVKLFMQKLVEGALSLGSNLEKRGCECCTLSEMWGARNRQAPYFPLQFCKRSRDRSSSTSYACVRSIPNPEGSLDCRYEMKALICINFYFKTGIEYKNFKSQVIQI